MVNVSIALMARYPLMQPKSGLNDLFYALNNNTRYLLHELASSEIRDVSNRLLSLHGHLAFNPQLPTLLVPTRGQILASAADGDQRAAPHQRGGHEQVQTRLLGRRRQVRKKEKHSQ